MKVLLEKCVCVISPPFPIHSLYIYIYTNTYPGFGPSKSQARAKRSKSSTLLAKMLDVQLNDIYHHANIHVGPSSSDMDTK